MDSQIEFAAIETDPTGKSSFISNSQLTERQKEVKERQSETAVLFGNLNANSVSKRGRLPKDSANATSSPQGTRLARSPTKEPGRLRFGESPQTRFSPAGLPESPLPKHTGSPTTRTPEVELPVGPVADVTIDSSGAQDIDEVIYVISDAVNEAEMRQGSGSPSVEDDNFVDAPEDRISSGEEAEEAPKNSASIAVEISRVQNSRACDKGSHSEPCFTPAFSANEENSNVSELNTESDSSQSRKSSPRVQIMTEERAASKLPAKRRRARPRPRRRSLVRKASESPRKVLGTIAVAEPEALQPKPPRASHQGHGKLTQCSPQKPQPNQISPPSSSPRKPPTVSIMSPPTTRSSVKKAAIAKHPAPTQCLLSKRSYLFPHFTDRN